MSNNDITQEINQELCERQNIKEYWERQLSKFELNLLENKKERLWGDIKSCDKIKSEKWEIIWELHEREHSLKKRGIQYDEKINLPIIIYVPHKDRDNWKDYLKLKYPSLLEKFKDYPSSKPNKMTKIYILLDKTDLSQYFNIISFIHDLFEPL
mgnify:CR=1 FL=1